MADTLKIKARPDCKACGGRGEVPNRVPVPFGVGMCTEWLVCDCIYDQVPEGRIDDEIEVEAADGYYERDDYEPEPPDDEQEDL